MTDPVSKPAPDLLRIEDLRVEFATPGGAIEAVRGVSFRVRPGGTVALVGESGSGKSVVSQSIMGILPKVGRITGGRILFNDPRQPHETIDLAALDRDGPGMRMIRGGRISIIFQEPMTSLSPVHTIGNQIGEALRLHRSVTEAEATELTGEMLGLVGFAAPQKALRTYPFDLSGGLRQRAMIAMALVCRPALLIADEPTTALDVTVQAQILDLLKRQQRERGMAMILVSHDLGVVAGRTDRIAVMYAGRFVEVATTPELFAHVRMPYTEALMRAIPRLDQPSHTRLLAIGGRPPDLVEPPPGCRFHPRCLYAQDRCRQEEPVLTPAGPDQGGSGGHQYACWYPVGEPARPA
jgi:oligopeptide/dipeptide ABC transporter ATP-binding protein